MAKRTRYSEYHDQYANYRLELDQDGILLMQCHTNGGSLVWDWRAHDQMSDVFGDIAGDREIKVLIHTGTGENYNANWGRLPNGDPVEKPDYLLMPGTRGLLKLDEKTSSRIVSRIPAPPSSRWSPNRPCDRTTL